ncbi:MAG: SWIM zinc finger family protein [Gemmatimonadetes bacterium]|nr:SWIM zinc finger family protein [Gemmatimonadota bacterium]
MSDGTNTDPLAHLASERLIELAGRRSWERGVRYFEAGCVVWLRLDRRRISATVSGTEPYDVRLETSEDELAWSCSCPMGAEGYFCKHAVATALAAVEARAEGTDAALDDREARARAALERRSPEELVELLLEQARVDPEFEDRLLLEAARSDRAGPDVVALGRLIDDATAVRGFLSRRGAYHYASGVAQAIATLSSLLEDGHAAIVIDLSERALTGVERALDHMDDSDGHAGPLLDDLHELHLAACRSARPDGEALAARLFERELDSPWEVFYGAFERYRDVLGARGVARYRQLAEAEWEQVKPLGPGEDDPDRFERRFRITRIMETLANADDDVARRVDIKTRDLSAPYRFLDIATVWLEAGEPERALEWGQRGLAAFDRPDARLTEFVAERLRELGRREDAAALAWEDFAARPSLERYQRLAKFGRDGPGWAEVRERAHGELRRLSNGSQLVSVLLGEGELDLAWEEADALGCSADVWLRLARAGARSRPFDAVPILEQEAERRIAVTNKRGYRAAVDVLGEIRDILRRAGDEDRFPRLVADVRARHARKKNLIGLLDQAGW